MTTEIYKFNEPQELNGSQFLLSDIINGNKIIATYDKIWLKINQTHSLGIDNQGNKIYMSNSLWVDYLCENFRVLYYSSYEWIMNVVEKIQNDPKLNVEFNESIKDNLSLRYYCRFVIDDKETRIYFTNEKEHNDLTKLQAIWLGVKMLLEKINLN